MRRRQEEGMADAPHTNPNPSSSHIEYVSEFYFISFRFNHFPTKSNSAHNTQTMRTFIEAK